MTLPPSPESVAALAPVRSWLLATAHQDAEAELTDAHADVENVLARARAEAAELLVAARADGAAQGAEAAARALTRGRREARATVLRAQADLQTALREQARAAVLALRDHEDYPALRDELARRARAVLGPEATITEAPSGGIVAHRGSRSVDLSLPVLADRALERLGGEVARLWT